MPAHIKIDGYRGIKRGTLQGLAPLTILVGPNNSGKSTVLEALALSAPGADGQTLKEIIDRRGAIGAQSLRAVAPQGAATITTTDNGSSPRLVSLSLDNDEKLSLTPHGTNRSYHVTMSDSGGGGWGGSGTPGVRPLVLEADRPSADPSELERVVSWSDLTDRRSWLIDVLKPLLPGLKDLRILVPGKRPTVYVEEDGGRWPASMAGDGFKRLLLLASKLATNRSGIALIEEPESFLHVGALPQLARLFWEACAKGTDQQIVLTTHSLEYIDAQFLNADPEQLSRAALFRLSLKKGELLASRIPGEKVQQLRAEIGEDLRR